MTDTLRQKMEAELQVITIDECGRHWNAAIRCCIALLAQRCTDKAVIRKVGEEIEKAVDDSNGEWTTSFKQYVAKAAISAIIGDNTPRDLHKLIGQMEALKTGYWPSEDAAMAIDRCIALVRGMVDHG